MVVYCTESDVYDATGMDSATIQSTSELSAVEVTALINRFIEQASQQVNEKLRIPETIHKEYHRGTGEDDEFALGPDDEHAFFPDYNPLNTTVQGYAFYYGTKRRKLPYPKNADMCENAQRFGGTATIVDDDGDVLTVNADQNGFTLTVGDASAYEVKDYIRIRDDNNEEYDQISSVDIVTNIITLQNPLKEDYLIADNAKVIGPIKSGQRTIHATYVGGQYIRYPSAQNLNKNIDIFDFVSFRLRSSSSTVTFTLHLYDKDGNSNSVTFSVDVADIWYMFHFRLDQFTAGTIDWSDIKCYYWELYADGACVVDVDNFNFNAEWFVTSPQGKLVIPYILSNNPVSSGYPLYITYGINEFNIRAPWEIEQATAKLAGYRLISWLIGVRQRETAFLVQGDTMVRVPDKETLYHTLSRLKMDANNLLKDYGFGFEFTPVRA